MISIDTAIRLTAASWIGQSLRSGKRPPTLGRRSSLLFYDALTAALGEHGEQVKPSGEDSKPVQGVRLKLLWAGFVRRFGRTAEAAGEAFRRALKAASKAAP